jgi:AraC-like DNA-binding protein
VLHIQRAGTRTVFQRGRDVTVEAGGAVFTSNGDPSRITLAGSSRFACIAIPRRIALALAPAAEDAVMRCVPPGAGVLRLLETYLGVLDDDEALRTSELRRTVTAHIYDLCALAIGAAREATEVAVQRGLRAARLRALKADVERNLVDGDVSPAALARRQGITARYVHKLFELDGTTLSRFKLRLRLSEVHRMLVGNGCAGATISEIAFSAGFNDLSTFNREFRRCYGVTPTELRAWARP